MLNRGGPHTVPQSSFLIFQRRKLRLSEKKPHLPRLHRNSQNTSDWSARPRWGSRAASAPLPQSPVFPQDCSSENSVPSLTWERRWPGLGSAGFSGKPNTTWQSSYWCRLSILEAKAAQGQPAVPGVSVGTLTCGQHNDSRADYVLGGLAVCLASPLSFRCPWVVSWLIVSSLQRVRKEGRASESLTGISEHVSPRLPLQWLCLQHQPHLHGHVRVEGCFHSYKLESWIWRVQILVLPQLVMCI